MTTREGAPPLDLSGNTCKRAVGRRRRGAPGRDGSFHDDSWRRVLAPYTEPSLARGLLDLASSVLAYLVMLVAIYFALRLSILLALALALPAAGFLLRTFIVFHDCAHASFFRSKRAPTP